jgi:hypothetical protein
MTDLYFEVLKHLAYPPDLAPSDFCLSPNLKGRKFSSIDEAALAWTGGC